MKTGQSPRGGEEPGAPEGRFNFARGAIYAIGIALAGYAPTAIRHREGWLSEAVWMIPLLAMIFFPFLVRDPPFGYIRNPVWRRRAGLAIVLLYGAAFLWLKLSPGGAKR
jgi:hypothetical protein